MPRESARLSRTEWKIMNLCWRHGRSTARQIYEASLDDQERDYQTVKTLLDRIAAKGFLTIEKLGPLCVYTPRVEKRQALSEAIQDFVDVVLDHALSPLFIHLAHDDRLSDDELEALQLLVEKREGEEKE